MLPNKLITVVATGLVLAGLAVPTMAGDVDSMELFAPSDISFFGSAPRVNEGFFFRFEGLVWWITPPQRTTIGFENATRLVYINETTQAVEQNSLTTGFLEANDTGGQRWDAGFVDGHEGWLFSAYRLEHQSQNYYASNVSVVFSDPPFGESPPRYHLQGPIDAALTQIENLPVRFDDMVIHDETWTWGVELNYIYRMHPNHHGGVFELFLGARYLEFNNEFTVEGSGGTLAESRWFTSAENHIVGPQIGGRWFRKGDRWTFSTEGRFLAGFNRQNFYQDGVLGSLLDPTVPTQFAISNMGPSSFSHAAHEDEFSPVVELRVNFSYQITAAISATVGWTGMWIDNISRASNVINYEVPLMGLDMGRNADDYVFMNGVTFGVEVNR